MTAFIQGEDLATDADPARKLWGYVLLMAVRDRVSSVHYHPWRGDGALAYVIANTRVEMRPPDAGWGERCVAAARSLLVRRRGFIGRILFAQPHPKCGTLVLGVEEHRIEWAVVCWSSGRRFGVEFFRITPIEDETASGSSVPTDNEASSGR
jgi:hypothetical protein